MEVAGLVVGVAGLAGSFTACIDCFERIRVARAYGRDWETAVIKIDLAWCRLSRWGRSMGISMEDGSSSVQTQEIRANLSTREENAVHEALGKICGLFTEIEKKQPRDAELLASEDFQTHSLRSLEARTREKAMARQRVTGLFKKSIWAVSKKAHLTYLLAEVTELLVGLERLAPPESQHRLCREQLDNIREPQGLGDLRRILRDPVGGDDSGIDDVLREALDDSIQKNGPFGRLIWSGNKVAGDGRSYQGDYVSVEFRGMSNVRRADYIAYGNTINERGRAHQGEMYGDTAF